MQRRSFLKAGLGAFIAGSLGIGLGEDEKLWADGTFSSASTSSSSPLQLWYQQPAGQWLEALALGNGRLGAMVYGGVTKEQIQLNAGTLWGGGPHDYDNPNGLAHLADIRRLVFEEKWNDAQNLANATFFGMPATQLPYQTVGSILLNFPTPTSVTNYRRNLDLTTATAHVSYQADGVNYTREAFISAVDQVLVLRLTADTPGKISFNARFDSPQKNASWITVDSSATGLTGTSSDAQGIPGAVNFRALARAIPEGGSVTANYNSVTVADANAVTLILSIATSYKNYQDVSGDPAAESMGYLNAAAKKSYASLKSAHIANYQKLFGRVSLDLGTSEAMHLPTDQRLVHYANGQDPSLAALHFQFGRYLLISCSRPGGQAATLQGLWNDSLTPPWESKYTININLEMNYWPAGPANLLDCYTPLFELLSDIAVTGAKTAKVQYGAGGWVAHHNTDGWRGTAPVDFALSGMWPTGGAWVAKSLWDHYEFTGDKEALAKHYPILKGAAQFFLDTLVEEPTHKWLVTCPSISPEHMHHGNPNASICAGPTMDLQILHDLFNECIQSSQILGIDSEFAKQCATARDRLAPMQIGSAGQLQEWLKDWDMQVPEIDHRHVSHLYGLYPSAQITKRGTPALYAAARKSLEIRGDETTGWGLAWRLNLWARLYEGDHAYKLIGMLLNPDRTYPNLFDACPPFEIDGNFGYVAGVCEMLLQSHTGEIELLPALPSAWQKGSIRGLRARGGHTIDIAWSNGKLASAALHSQNGGTVLLRTAAPVVVKSSNLRVVHAMHPSPGLTEFNAVPGQTYQILPA